MDYNKKDLFDRNGFGHLSPAQRTMLMLFRAGIPISDISNRFDRDYAYVSNLIDKCRKKGLCRVPDKLTVLPFQLKTFKKYMLN